MTVAQKLLLPGLLLLALTCLAAALATGSESLPLARIAEILAGGGSAGERDLVLQLRLPRALSAFAVGGLLALAGVLMQVLLRNPLADPYILGTSGGAAVGALAALSVGLAPWAVDAGAFTGALGAMLIVFVVAHGSGSWTPARLLLTGVVLASGLSAVIGLLLTLSPEQGIHGMLFWLMGDFSFAHAPAPLLVVLAVGTALSLAAARELNVLARGETMAAILGQRVALVQAAIFVGAALLTGVAVTAAGTIGFVGLVVPHMIRLVTGSEHRRVIPAAAVAGGCLLVVADTLARTAMAPRQLPVGTLTALLGVPLFLALMWRQRR
ncbi:FecCD family ABC transporter permease [Lentisalinibacter sediminis]|uniref:FecCD family ABC transporter permease n=1 Tax=Lentisalinibacter sediminis TaxID=2992237 RepID=UPI00386CB509